jgi:hypothetical protein
MGQEFIADDKVRKSGEKCLGTQTKVFYVDEISELVDRLNANTPSSESYRN